MDIIMKEQAAIAVTRDRLLQKEQRKLLAKRSSGDPALIGHLPRPSYYEAIGDFILLLEHNVQSPNPFNKLRIDFIKAFGILSEHHWDSYQHFIDQTGQLRLSHGRADVVGEYRFIYRHLALMIVSGGYSDPIILDKDFRVIDGLQRLLAMRLIPGCEFSAIRLNYEHHGDRSADPV
jgi:hypothetical protein